MMSGSGNSSITIPSPPSPATTTTMTSSSTAGGRSGNGSSVWYEYVVYSFIGSTGLLLLLTAILAISLIIALVCLYKAKKNKKDLVTTAAKGKVNPSYWITDYELDPPRVSSSTPNLSDWSSPPLSCPSRTFFSPLSPHDIAPASNSRERSGIAPSVSMAPLVPKKRREEGIRKSHSHSDLTHLPPNTSGQLSQQRRTPPSPPVFPVLSPTPSGASASGGDETPKPMPRRKKKKPGKKGGKSPVLPTKRGSGSDGGGFDNRQCAGAYVDMHRFPSSTETSPQPFEKSPSPVYQRINTKSRDTPAQYETIELFRK